MASVGRVIKGAKSALDNVLDGIEQGGAKAADEAFVAQAKAVDKGVGDDLDAMLDEIEGKSASPQAKGAPDEWMVADTSTPESPPIKYDQLLDEALAEIEGEPLPVMEVEEVSEFSAEGQAAMDFFAVGSDSSGFDNSTDAIDFLIDESGSTLMPDDFLDFPIDMIKEKAHQVQVGLISVDEAMESMLAVSKPELGPPEFFQLETLHDHLSDWQIAALPPEKQTLAYKQLAGEHENDNVSLTLAQHADDMELEFGEGVPPERIPVVRVFKAIRGDTAGGDLNRAPGRVPLRMIKYQNEMRSADKGISTENYRRAFTPEYIEAVEKLNKTQINALNLYTDRGDQAMNWGLRNGEVAPGSALEKTIQYVNDTLDQLPPYQHPAYRGAGKEAWHRYQVGEEVVEEGFSSFTASKLGRTYKEGGDEHRVNTIFVIQSKTGRYIEPFTNFEGEHEVLFKAGTRFRVVDKDPDTRQVFLEEIE